MTEYHAIGIEFGSTRIKAVLVDRDFNVLAQGGFNWENRLSRAPIELVHSAEAIEGRGGGEAAEQNTLVDGLWTYPLEQVWAGLQAAYAELAADALAKYNQPIATVDSIGISAMMHGYLAFDSQENLLVPFRTWRNTNTGPAAAELTTALNFAIPQRWSVAHAYQAVLNGEEHVSKISFLTTLAGYVHWQLTGQKVLGIGDASGMFPIDSTTRDYDIDRLARAQDLFEKHGVTWRLIDVLPTVLLAGQPAGELTEAGAKLLDPSGILQPGIPLCPPEGDAGTGMVATNAVAPRTGNVSAGTSIFAMVVLQKALSRLHEEIDMVTTPLGDPVAMVHCNNGASEIDAWVHLFGQFAAAAGFQIDDATLFGTLFRQALQGKPDGGGLIAFNNLAGEPITHLEAGRPLVLRTPDSELRLPEFMRTLIMSAFGTLSIGMRILHEEGVELDSLFAHGGVFGTPEVAQRLLAAALNVPITVGTTAAEGGAWGQAVLAGFAADSRGLELPEFLNRVVFASTQTTTIAPDPVDRAGFVTFLDRYEKALPVEASAVVNS